MSRFDFIVIGGGSGGIAAARRAAQYGKSVAVIEAKRLGGTCVNTGCVPKKVMFHAASIAETLKDAAGFGFSPQPSRVDWGALRHGRDEYVQRLNKIYAANLDKDGVRVVRGRARLLNTKEVEVDGMKLSSDHILIATGTHPKMPDIPGAQLGITSDGFFGLSEQPKRVAIIGTGYIGVELTGIFQLLGSQVCLFSRYDDVLPHFDPLIYNELRQQMVEAGVDFQPHTTAARVARGDDGRLKVVTQTKVELSGFDCLVWAIGRAPSTPGLGLEEAGVQLDPEGYVRVDERQNTNVPGIYAVGDVAGHVTLTPVAIAAGRHLADRLFGGRPDYKLSFENIPTVVFSHPPIAAVGLTEAEAEERYGRDNIRVYTSRFTNLYYAMTRRRPSSAMKLVTLASENERVIGLHAIGLGSDEMVQGFAVAMNAGATRQTFEETVAVHPTAAEEFVTMKWR